MQLEIQNEKQYETALERVYSLMQANVFAGTSQSDKLELLTNLIVAYEEIHHPISRK